jgi:hypothetical protein
MLSSPVNEDQSPTINTTKKIDTVTNSIKEGFNVILEEIDFWLIVILSSISCLFLILLTLLYILAKIKIKSKDNLRQLFKKVWHKEHLIFLYCLSLLFSHLVSLTQSIVKKILLGSTTLDPNFRHFCLTIGIVKHFFWLLTIMYSSAISFKMYAKFTKNLNKNLLNNKQTRFKSVLKTYSYIFLPSFLIVLIASFHHFKNGEEVYDRNINDKTFSCFLQRPLYIMVFFAVPVTLVVVLNFGLFLFVIYRTKQTKDQQQNNEQDGITASISINTDNNNSQNMINLSTASFIFLKLGIIMGLSWIIYIVSILVIDFTNDNNYLLIQSFIILSSCQVNLQGFMIVVALFSNVVHERFARKRRQRINQNKRNQLQQQLAQQQLHQIQSRHNLNNPIHVIHNHHQNTKLREK